MSKIGPVSAEYAAGVQCSRSESMYAVMLPYWATVARHQDL